MTLNPSGAVESLNGVIKGINDLSYLGDEFDIARERILIQCHKELDLQGIDDVLTVDADGSNLWTIGPPDPPGKPVGPWSTWDGRIVYVDWTEPDGRAGDVWVTDADGGNPTQLEATIPALTAAGCMNCPYPVSSVESGADPLAVPTAHPFEEFWINTMYWQPSPAGQR